MPHSVGGYDEESHAQLSMTRWKRPESRHFTELPKRLQTEEVACADVVGVSWVCSMSTSGIAVLSTTRLGLENCLLGDWELAHQ